MIRRRKEGFFSFFFVLLYGFLGSRVYHHFWKPLSLVQRCDTGNGVSMLVPNFGAQEVNEEYKNIYNLGGFGCKRSYFVRLSDQPPNT